ncbi:hypothetical protein ACQ7HM_08295 [Williamsia sp. MIQD14]|uniref:hypothetical protein n=1 Tax=Williamsia sp. MIQD14 TaxID=3425703 RepID=UPI003DA05149
MVRRLMVTSPNECRRFARHTYGVYRRARPQSWAMPVDLLEVPDELPRRCSLSRLGELVPAGHALFDRVMESGCSLGLSEPELVGVAMAINSVEVDAGRFDAVLTIWRAVESVSLEDYVCRSIVRRFLAQSLSRVGQHTEARALGATAILEAQRSRRTDVLSDAYYINAWCAEQRGGFDRAYAMARLGLDAAERGDSHTRLIDCLNAVGSYAAELGRLDEAEVSCTRAADMASTCGATKSQLAALDSLADIARIRGDRGRVIELLEQVRAGLVSLSETYHLADVDQRLESARTLAASV